MSERGATVKILFLGSNASDTARLRLDQEVRDAREVLARAGVAGVFQFEVELAVRPKDLATHLLHHKPDILHFSGHGAERSREPPPAPKAPPPRTRELLPEDDAPAPPEQQPGGGIVLEDENGNAVAVRPEALTELLRILRRETRLRCVVLNACFTASQAEAIAGHVDCVVGMRRAISDKAAIAFAVGFYRALANDTSVGGAFELGCSAIDLQELPERDVPQLFHRPDVRPEEVFIGRAKPAPPFPWRRVALWTALAAAALACVAGACLLFLPPMSVERGQPGSGTIVVAGTWLPGSDAAARRSKLCAALDDDEVRQEGEPKVQCLALPRVGAGEAEVREEALAANASLLVLVDDAGVARLLPLSGLSEHEILARGLPSVDLTLEASIKQLAPLLRSLAHIADVARDPARMNYTRLRCERPDSPRPSIEALALLTGMYAQACQPSKVNARELIEPCQEQASPDARCQLALLLYVHYFTAMPDAREALDALASAPGPVQTVAVKKAALQACREGKVDAAAQAMMRLWGSDDACVKMQASAVAACLLQARQTAAASDTAELWVLEAFAGGSEARACEDVLRAGVLGERAYWRGRGKRWSDAAVDYLEAWNGAHRPNDLLNRVEVLLHAGQIDEAARHLASLKGDASVQPTDGVRAELLMWILESRRGNTDRARIAAQRLKELYEKLAPGARPVEDPTDPVLRPLACPDEGAQCAVLEALAAGKDDAAVDLLKRSLP